MTPEENRARVSQWQRENPDKVSAKNARAYQKRKEARQIKSRLDYRSTVAHGAHVRPVDLGSQKQFS